MANSKVVFLFEVNPESGLHTFKGQLTCIGYHTFIGPDKNGHQRSMIRFEFEMTDKNSNEMQADSVIDSKDLSELRMLASSAGTEDSNLTIKDRKIIVRKRAAGVRKYALVRSNGICEACDASAPFNTPNGDPFLEVHHLTRLSDGSPDTPEHVAAICPNCHRRVHYSFDANEYNFKLINIIAFKER
ncbi:HNH endonuclease signature motif containing protein [Neobacillus sp. 179-C4.2 HS]|uniref:HNH endonuclease signature motif containing protein n=1 Tax=Neobacillus driksii TaxID=3035913 RepID=A0ABV4YUC6_9BACI|nr:HNH endonuclease signature motif containing protein [Neobacillus sp. 179.-C4.2 HS]MDP5195027.1 HNH endonuclease signature motif containing protein [Neobacillus sp. 179.-C4.2 HS]